MWTHLSNVIHYYIRQHCIFCQSSLGHGDETARVDLTVFLLACPVFGRKTRPAAALHVLQLMHAHTHWQAGSRNSRYGKAATPLPLSSPTPRPPFPSTLHYSLFLPSPPFLQVLSTQVKRVMNVTTTGDTPPPSPGPLTHNPHPPTHSTPTYRPGGRNSEEKSLKQGREESHPLPTLSLIHISEPTRQS